MIVIVMRENDSNSNGGLLQMMVEVHIDDCSHLNFDFKPLCSLKEDNISNSSMHHTHW